MCFAGLAFAPLELEEHDQHDILYEWDEAENSYSVYVSWSTFELAQKLDYEDEEFDEQAWASKWSYILPTEQNEDETDLLIWKWGESEDEPNKVVLTGVPNSDILEFINSVDDTRFSVSVEGGDLDGTKEVGIDHPTDLGDGLNPDVSAISINLLHSSLEKILSIVIILPGTCSILFLFYY